MKTKVTKRQLWRRGEENSERNVLHCAGSGDGCATAVKRSPLGQSFTCHFQVWWGNLRGGGGPVDTPTLGTPGRRRRRRRKEERRDPWSSWMPSKDNDMDECSIYPDRSSAPRRSGRVGPPSGLVPPTFSLSDLLSPAGGPAVPPSAPYTLYALHPLPTLHPP